MDIIKFKEIYVLNILMIVIRHAKLAKIDIFNYRKMQLRIMVPAVEVRAGDRVDSMTEIS